MLKTLLFSLFLFSSLAYGAQEALVSSSKAIIYADEDLTVPLGYVTRGKKVIVGNQALKKGLLYSVVVHGKIAFIQSKDITVVSLNAEDTDKKVREHNFEDLDVVEEEVFSLNNFISVAMSTMDMGDAWTSTAETTDAENTSKTIPVYRLLFEHRDRKFLLNYSVGFDVMNKQQNQIKFSAWGFEGNAHFSPLRNTLLALDCVFGLSLFPSVRVDNPMALESEKTGNMYGYQYGLILRLFPYSKWGFFGGFMQSKYSLKIDPIVTQQESTLASDPVYSNSVETFGGPSLTLGVSYKF